MNRSGDGRTIGTPRVSVVVTCHNLGRYLDEAVNSVLAQTMRDFEIIIVNDGSTDDFTNRLLADYRKPKTTVYKTENRGPAAARNVGIEKASAPYIFPLDADDILEPECLEKTTGLLDTSPDIAVASFWYRGFGADEFEYSPPDYDLVSILAENSICGNSLFRRRIWEEVGGYDEEMREGCEDWEFWIRVLAAGYRVKIIPEFLFRYRIRRDSRDSVNRRPESRMRSMRYIVEKHRRLYEKYFIEVLIKKDRLLVESNSYQCELRHAVLWYKSGREKHERYIAELEARVRELHGALRDARKGNEETIREQSRLIDEQRRLLDLREHELCSLRSSKAWRMGCALKDARRSLKGFVLLPFRIARIMR